MTIRRNINGNIETIELTNVEMEKAFEIIRMNDLKEYFKESLLSIYPDVINQPCLYDKLFTDFLSKRSKIDSTDDEDAFNIVMERNKQLIKSFEKTRE